MRKQIIIAFVIIFSLFTLGAGFLLYNLITTTSNLRHLIGLHEIEDIRQGLNLSVQKVQGYVNASGTELSHNLDGIITNIDKVETSIRQCHECHHEPDVQAELDYTEHLAGEFKEKLSHIITSAIESKWRIENKRQANEIGDKILIRVQEMVNRAAITIQRKTEQAMEQIHQSYYILLVILAITFLLAVLIAQLLTTKIVSPINALLTSSRRITEGDLGFRTDYQAADEFGELINTFNEMSMSLAAKEKENVRLYQDLEQKIAELQNTQKQLVEAEKLTALGTLAGGIAHDFNNILCGIISNISLLKKEHEPKDEEHKILDIIEKAGFRAANLVQQLLTFSRQETWEDQPVNINETISLVINLLKNTLRKGVTVNLNLADRLPAINGDPARLEQVIMNLCINARDAMPEGGEITIKTSSLFLDSKFCESHPDAWEGNYIELSVADTGTGIDQKIISRIFEPFFTTKAFGQGTGLGLSMVHGIIKSHNGFCLVSNQPDKGACFTIYLPIPQRLPE